MPVVWVLRPYELLVGDYQTGWEETIDGAKVRGLMEDVRRFQEDYGLQPIGLAPCARMYGA